MTLGNKIASGIGVLANKTLVEKEITAMGTLKALRKEARQSLKDNAVWQQEYHGNEIVAVMAVLTATRQELLSTQRALKAAKLLIR